VLDIYEHQHEQTEGTLNKQRLKQKLSRSTDKQETACLDVFDKVLDDGVHEARKKE